MRLRNKGTLNTTLVYNLDKAFHYFENALVNGQAIEPTIKEKWKKNIGFVSRYFEGDDAFINTVFEIDKLIFGER